MRKEKKIKKRFNQLWNDLKNISKNHGLKVLIFYSVMKIITKIPLLSLAFKKAFRQKLLVKVKILNNRMYLNLLDPGISYRLIVDGIREPGHVEQVQSVLKAGMKGIDIGANIGYYVLIESELVGPEGKIFAIEPAPDNFSLLRENIKEKNFGDRERGFQHLVGDTYGSGRLFLSEAANSHSVSPVSGDESIEVPMVTLDQFMVNEDIDPSEIDFLRMDIEGYEVMAMQHMNSLFAGRKKPLYLFIEVHKYAYEQWGWTLEKFIDYLISRGFILKSVVEREIDGQGLIKDRAVSVTNGKEPVEVLKRMIKRVNESGILGNLFLELPVNP